MKQISHGGTGLDLLADENLYDRVRKVFGSNSLRQILVAGADGTALSGAQADDEVRQRAGILSERGVRRGDRVAILSTTSLDWVLTDLAVLALGAVVVPVYPTSSAHQIAHILADSGAVLGIADTDTDSDRLVEGGVPAITFDDLIDASAAALDIEDTLAACVADDVAMIVYTSGTTGPAKGCVISHRNMFAAASNTVLRTGDMFVDPTAVTALALPLSHVFGQTILFAGLLGGTKTHFISSIPELIPQLPSISPSFLALVPYALEKIRKIARQGLTPADEAEAIARGHTALTSTELEASEPVAGLLGGRLTNVISGGASLDATTVAFYAGFGVRLLNCYGMTETATAVTVNEPTTNRVGTVGRPIPGTTVAIADDGEVLVGGANVSRGYWGAAADKTAVDAEGWLHTGDIGELDADGYLVITGRKKEILVTSGGKNVAPTPLEDRIRLHPLVSNCIAIGDGRPFVTALVTLDQAQYARWRKETTDATDDLTDTRLTRAVQQAIDDANSLVSRAESIREFRIVEGDFTVQEGLLTSSLKLKRSNIIDTHRHLVDELYAIRV